MFGSAQNWRELDDEDDPPLQMDDDDHHYAPMQVAPKGRLRRRWPPPESGRVQPGTKESRSWSRSWSSGGPTNAVVSSSK